MKRKQKKNILSWVFGWDALRARDKNDFNYWVLKNCDELLKEFFLVEDLREKLQIYVMQAWEINNETED